ncbi:stealth conserved region 3 domain-containing protein [Flexistipes sp.]|uniref:stealth conserved region 3 domain-containing protein n=1 Tax=Flexistipes sp. TaxID=3088135 RepID=UPI002E1C1CEA|nr:stealth conserved region 3 domain-containing protein [Flexistipes sp.]
MISKSLKIDAVYLWVDDNDSEWREKKNFYCSSNSKNNSAAVHECRFRDNDELRYSLRSLEKYAPWINNVFIIADNQKPSWINEKEIQIIDHKEIFPDWATLPNFNSNAIELCSHRIKNLNEHYMLFNDDFILGNAVYPDYFFNKNGTPRSWAIEKKSSKIKKSSHDYYTKQIIEKKMSSPFLFKVRHYPKVFKKTIMLKIWEEFKDEVRLTLKHRFRSSTDLRIITFFPHFAYYNNLNEILPINKIVPSFRYFGFKLPHIGASLGDKNFRKKLLTAKYLKPLSFCFNDAPKASGYERKLLIDTYKKMFPEKSRFEI